MKSECGLFPSLGKHFSNLEEMAEAGCMSRRRLYSILKGEKRFTEAEQKAIKNAVAIKAIREHRETELIHKIIENQEGFDELFKIKE